MDICRTPIVFDVHVHRYGSFHLAQCEDRERGRRREREREDKERDRERDVQDRGREEGEREREREREIEREGMTEVNRQGNEVFFSA